MNRFAIPLVLLVAFVGWVLYRLLVKRDLHKHWNEVGAGLFFFAVWALIYYWIAF